MLVLKLKPGQSVHVGPNIVTILESKGHVRIGIIAPPNVPIVRDKVKQRDEAKAVSP